MLDDKVLVAALLTVLGWIIVYRLGLHAGRQRALEDLATRRAQLATGLLVELRTLEQFFSRLRADTKPLKSRWHVPCQFFDAKLASLDLLSPASVREAMDLFGIINDIRVFRERYPGPDDATDTNNWFVRVKASVALQRVATLKKALESDGGLLSEGQAVAALTYPALPAIPARAFSQNTLEYDETGAIRLLEETPRDDRHVTRSEPAAGRGHWEMDVPPYGYHAIVDISVSAIFVTAPVPISRTCSLAPRTNRIRLPSGDHWASYPFGSIVVPLPSAWISQTAEPF